MNDSEGLAHPGGGELQFLLAASQLRQSITLAIDKLLLILDSTSIEHKSMAPRDFFGQRFPRPQPTAGSISRNRQM
jgi:hypothetical protein